MEFFNKFEEQVRSQHRPKNACTYSDEPDWKKGFVCVAQQHLLQFFLPQGILNSDGGLMNSLNYKLSGKICFFKHDFRTTSCYYYFRTFYHSPSFYFSPFGGLSSICKLALCAWWQKQPLTLPHSYILNLESVWRKKVLLSHSTWMSNQRRMIGLTQIMYLNELTTAARGMRLLQFPQPSVCANILWWLWGRGALELEEGIPQK